MPFKSIESATKIDERTGLVRIDLSRQGIVANDLKNLAQEIVGRHSKSPLKTLIYLINLRHNFFSLKTPNLSGLLLYLTKRDIEVERLDLADCKMSFDIITSFISEISPSHCKIKSINFEGNELPKTAEERGHFLLELKKNNTIEKINFGNVDELAKNDVGLASFFKEIDLICERNIEKELEEFEELVKEYDDSEELS